MKILKIRLDDLVVKKGIAKSKSLAQSLIISGKIYLGEKKLDILGNPIPVEKDNIDWSADKLTFDFEIGLSPEFEVSLKNKKAIASYEIDVDKKMIDDQIKNIQNQYGKLIAQTKIEDGFEINGKFLNEEFEVDNTSNFKLNDIKGKGNKDSLKKLKI